MSGRLEFVIRLALAALLAWAGVLKALDPAAFAEAIQGFRLTTVPVAAALALYLPWLELLLAAGLLAPRWRSGALLVTTVLFAAFTALWMVTWLRGIDVACGCFGGAGHTPAAWGFVRALIPAFAAGWALRAGKIVKPA